MFKEGDTPIPLAEETVFHTAEGKVIDSSEINRQPQPETKDTSHVDRLQLYGRQIRHIASSQADSVADSPVNGKIQPGLA